MRFALLVVFSLVGCVQADLPTLINDILPHTGDGSFQAGLKCYLLPYGIVGFVSHIASYYVLICLTFSVRPMMPWRFLKKWKTDMFFGVMSLLFTLLFSILSAIRCRFDWPFILISTWKTTFGFWVACTAIHRALDVRRTRKEQEAVRSENRYRRAEHKMLMSVYERELENSSQNELSLWQSRSTLSSTGRPELFLDWEEALRSKAFGYWPLVWAIPYACGVIVGLVGLSTVVFRNWSTRTKAMEYICEAFGGFTLLIGVAIFTLSSCLKSSFRHSVVVSWVALWVTITAMTALWSDWILAAISVRDGGNWLGLPDADRALAYWGYFAAKRLPGFSW